jgi:hypothetical protein
MTRGLTEIGTTPRLEPLSRDGDRDDAGLADTSCCPSPGREHKRSRWQHPSAPFAELRLSRRVETSQRAGRYAQR